MSCELLPLVDAHFARTSSTVDEARMRAHLPGCAECTRRYERQYLLSRALPDAASSEDRLGAALGFAPRPGRARARAWWAAVLLPAAAAGVLTVALTVALRTPEETGFTPRGADAGALSWLEVYRLQPGQTPAPAPARVAATDALAFAYRNPDGHPYLMLFAVDARQRVHWYFPEWTDPAADPGAVRIERGAAVRELPAAVTQPLAPGPVTLHALFLDTPRTVKDVERALGEQQPLLRAGEAEVLVALEVAP